MSKRSRLDNTPRGAEVTVDSCCMELDGVHVSGHGIYTWPRRANAKPIAVRGTYVDAYDLIEARGFVVHPKYPDVSPGETLYEKIDRMNDE